MKKSLYIIASVALIVTLAGCPGNPPNPPASPSPSPVESPTSGPTDEPVSTPTPGGTTPTANPGSTPTPLPAGSALPTPPPPSNTGFSITGATAVKQPDFSYVYTLNGTDLGTIGDYANLQVEVSGSTVTLVQNGQSRVNGVDLKDLNISPTGISFRWVNPFGAPTSNDLVKLNYTKNNEQPKTSTAIRLSVQ